MLSGASLDLSFPLANLQSRKNQSRSHELTWPCRAALAWDASLAFLPAAHGPAITAGCVHGMMSPVESHNIDPDIDQEEAAMKSRAAVAVEKGKPLQIMDV